MPLNQFDIKPQGTSYNGQGISKQGNNRNNHYNNYYTSPTFDRMTGGIGAGNSSYGLRATSNDAGLVGHSPEYERALGELAATLAFNRDTTQVQRYVAPSYSGGGSYKPQPSYISVDNVNTGSLYGLGDVSPEILKAQLIMKANGYDVNTNGVYDTKFANAMSAYKADNGRTNDYAGTYGNKTIDVLNNATNKVTVDDYNKALGNAVKSSVGSAGGGVSTVGKALNIASTYNKTKGTKSTTPKKITRG